MQWTKHASRSDSQAQQHDLTSRGGVLEEPVFARCPQHVSTTTNTTQPQGLALCSRCHPAWASEGTPVRPSKDTHGTLGPGKRGGRGWPTTTAQRAKCRTHQTVQNTGLPTNRFCIVSWKDEREPSIKYGMGRQIDVVQKFTRIQRFGQN